jgi:uncharacterized membrane protein
MDATRWRRWRRRVVIIGVTGAMAALTFGVIKDPTPKGLAVIVAIPASGLYTLALWATRRWWLPVLARRPVRNAILLGIFNAAVVETMFLIMEKVTGAKGVAAHPNLIADLLITMPWYVPMVWTFVRVQNRQRFAAVTVLLLAGLYESGADGVLAGWLLPVVTGQMHPFNPRFFLLLALVMFWGFIPVYSSFLLPPAWVLEAARPAGEPPALPQTPAWRDALKPLLWLIAYAAIAVPIMMLGGGK